MNKIILSTFISIFTMVIVAGETSVTNVVRRKITGKERMAKRMKRIAEAGGLVSKPYNGKYIYIVNDQTLVAEKDFFKDERNSIEGLFGLPVKVVAPRTELEKAGLTITLSDTDAASSLLVAPEAPWAGINVRALMTDKPNHEILISRLQKEIWRAFMYGCGAANSTIQPCVMRQISQPSDLDRQSTLVPCPDSLQRVMNTAKILGIEPAHVSTYKQACQEGWAPAPTNDVQKKVWADVHNAPKNPMTIKYDPKKGR